jgi:ADP-ribose pyrophosphatase
MSDIENGTNGTNDAAQAETPATPEVAAEAAVEVTKSEGAVKAPKAVKKPKAVKAPKKAVAAKPAKPAKKKAAAKKATKPETMKTADAVRPAKVPKPAAKAGKATKKATLAKKSEDPGGEKKARILDSKVVYEGPLFRVLSDHLIEPGGRESRRDVIRHNGSVVILAVDQGKKGKRKNPWIVVERQYRHAAGQFLWELPAGKLDAGEEALAGAKRELSEETGYQARKWTQLMEYYASPGFLGESMKIFLAEGLVAGDAHPEEDEQIDFRLVRLSELLELVDTGKIIDGKTLSGVLLYARQLGLKRKK